MSDTDLGILQGVVDDSDAAGYDLSANVARDIVHLSRGNVVANEEQFLLSTLGYATGWCYSKERFVNSVLIGPSSGGKTQVQKHCARGVPSELALNVTDFSGNALLDSERWDHSLVAILDEIDKLNSGVREQLKSMAGEDGGMSKLRNVEDQSADGGYSPDEVSSESKPFQYLYAPTSNKQGIPEELNNRVLKIYVDDGKVIRELIGRKEAGHENIMHPSLDHEYIYGTDGVATALRDHLRALPTLDIEDDDGTLQNRRGGTLTVMPRWVWYAVDPIFNKGQTFTNRVFGMVFNLIRGSAVWNHHERDRVTVEGTYEHLEGDTHEAILVAPQDVANVLACQRTLLSTTHKLTPRKRSMLKAVRKTQGADTAHQEGDTSARGTTVEQIKSWLDRNDKPCPSKSRLREILRSLAEQYFLRINEGAGPSGAHLYEWRSSGAIDTPRITDLQSRADRDDVTLGEYGTDVSDPFAGTTDPIRDQPFVETIQALVEEFNDGPTSTTSASRFMSETDGGDDTDGDDTDGSDTATTPDETSDQQRLDGEAVPQAVAETTPERNPRGPVENAVVDTIEERIADASHDDGPFLPVPESPDKWLDDSDLASADDPLWDHPEIAEDTVVDDGDARRLVADACARLQEADVLVTDRDGRYVPKGFTRLFVAL